MITVIVQARVGSTRLPGKVLRDLSGKPMLVRVIERIQRAEYIDEIIIATTENTQDDKIVSLCQEYGWKFYRGSEDDVLERYYQAARKHQATIVVRITSDCPLIDPTIIDKVIKKFVQLYPNIDYVSNVFPQNTYPRGLSVEVISFEALERAWKKETNPSYREHVTPHIYRNPDKFRIAEVTHTPDLSFMRWTVDTTEDFEFVSRVYKHFGDALFSWWHVLMLLEKQPELLDINKGIEQVKV